MNDHMNFDEIHQRDSDILDGHAQIMLQQERERVTLETLMRCKQAGAYLADLEMLASELGLRREWIDYQQTHHP